MAQVSGEVLQDRPAANVIDALQGQIPGIQIFTSSGEPNAIPSIRLSTSEARRVMPQEIPINDAVINLGALTLLLQGLRNGNEDLIADGMRKGSMTNTGRAPSRKSNF